MATVQEPVKAPSGRHDRFVQQQLAQATRRVLVLDLTSSFLMLLIGTMVFGLAIMLLDRAVNLPQFTRQIALLGFLCAAGAFVWFRVLRPFRQPINPYYAARQVEQTIPDAKNSVINWLDLHNEDLPPAVHTALGSRAASDLKESDLNEAVPAQQLGWLGGIAGGLLVAVVIALAVMRPGQFFSLFDRAFNPFGSTAVAKQTNITVIEPQGGNAVVPVRFPVTIRVKVDGRIPDNNKPDSLRMLLRRIPEDTNYEEIALTPEGDNTEWTVKLGAERVQNGFWYKVVGGDDETPEYRVAVRSSPLVARFELTYKFRPYLQWQPRTASDPNIEQLSGTEVTLVAHTNRDVREGRLVVDPVDAILSPDDLKVQDRPIKATTVPGQPDALQFKFVIKKDAKYWIHFTSVEGEQNKESLPYAIKALRDMPPDVKFTKPLELAEPEPKCQLQRPANGMLRLEGTAQDDYGLTKITLRMKLQDGRIPEPKVFHHEKDFKLDTGAYMRSVDYMDFVEFEKLKTVDGAAIKVGAGDILEYWLEVEDNCDFPGPNIGTTKHFKVLILERKKDEDEKKELQEQKDKAQQDKQDNDKKFDEQRQKDNEESKKQQAEQNQAGKKDEKNQQGGDKEKSELEKKIDEVKKDIEEQKKQDANNQPKKDEHGNAKPDQAKPEDGNQQKPDDKNNQGKPDQAKPQDGNQQKPDDKNNQGKPDQAKPQDGNQQKPDDKNNQGKPDQSKPQDGNQQKPDDKNNQGKPDQSKPQDGNQQKPDDKNNQGKPDQAKPQDGNQQKPDDKNSNQQNADAKPNDKGESKDMKPDANMQPPADQKGPPQEGNGAGDSKPKGAPEQPPQKGDSKPSGESKPDPNAMGEPKNQPDNGAEGGQGEAKRPPKPWEKDPNNPKDNGMNPGANPDPKQNNDPGQAKGNPDKNQKPENNPNNPNQPNDPKSSDNKQQGPGAEGDAKPDDKQDQGQGQAKKRPPWDQDGGGTAQQDQKQDQGGNAKGEKPPQDNHGQAKASDNNDKNPPGHPKGDMGQGNQNDQQAKKDAGQAKPDAGQAPMGNTGQFEQSKGNDKPDKGAGEPKDQASNNPKPDSGSGGDKDVSKLEKQMKEGDPKASADAKNKLEQMAKDNSNPQKQKDAQDALKKNDQQDKNGGQLGAAKKPPEKPEQGNNPMGEKTEQVSQQKPKNTPQEPGECKH